MANSNFVLRFVDVAEQPSPGNPGGGDVVRRILGFVEARHLIELFNNASLTPNPRSAKRNAVTSAVLDTLRTNPELFRFMSKGILVGTSSCQALERKRFRLSFGEPDIEGILDGGHNMLAIGLHILEPLMSESAWRKIRSWDDMTAAWTDHWSDILETKSRLDFQVPVELLVPTATNGEVLDEFAVAILEICEARNNNVQLPQEAAANKKGFYEDIRAGLPDAVAARVEWRPGDWEDASEKRPIKVRDLLALAWIPLNCLGDEHALPIPGLTVSPQNIYKNKAECSSKFETLMANPEVSERKSGARHELIHDGVRSALKVLTDLPDLYDQIYEDFPAAYNRGNRRFGANPIVKLFDPERRTEAVRAGKDAKGYVSSQPLTPFMRRPVKYRYPEGLIAPLVYGLKGLMKVENGEVSWAVPDVRDFVSSNLGEIAEQYKLVLEMGAWDPQKIAKNSSSHEFAVQQFKTALMASRL